MRCGLPAVVSVLVIALGAASVATHASAKDPACVDRYLAPPNATVDVECWMNPGVGAEERDALRARLRDWADTAPDDPWIALALAIYDVERTGKGVEERTTRAIEAFRARGDRTGEAMGEALLARHFHRFRREPERAGVLARLHQLEATIDDPIVRTRILLADCEKAESDARIDEAFHWANLALLQPAFATMPRSLQLTVLARAKNAAIQLNRYSETLALIRRSRALCGDHAHCVDRDALDRARLARYMHANWLEDRAVAADLTRVAYQRSSTSGSKWAALIEACEAGRLTDPPESLGWFERCGEIAADLRCDDVRFVAQGLHAVGVARLDPGRLDESLARMPAIVAGLRRVGVVHEEIAGLANWSSLLREAGRIPEAIAVQERAVALSIDMHDRQIDADVRADKMAFEAKQFFDLAHLLAVAPESRAHHDLAEAHRVLETFRVRASQLELRRADVVLDEAPAPGVSRSQDTPLSRTRAAIVRIQSELGEAGLSEAAREEKFRALEREEVEERRLLVERERVGRSASVEPIAEVATLESVRDALGEREVLVSFQIASVSGRRPWALVITRRGAYAVELGGRSIESALGLLIGLLARRDGGEREALDVLGEALIEPWFSALADQINEIVVVPDGRLFDIPIAALPVRRGGSALGAHAPVTLVTSATAFVARRQRAPDVTRRSALALAHSPGGRTAVTSIGRWRDDARSLDEALGPLTEASAEARSVALVLGAESRVLEGHEASERAVKRLALERFGVLHVAAHAIANHERPGRSAIVLAPGAPDEDGLLQPREIAGLHLDGRIVVLAACSSAAGPDVRGGGPRSLAAAFLHAGASAVVGTLWPVRDAEARRFADVFYREVSAGATVADALTKTQTALRNAGDPVTSWGAYVLYGDGKARVQANEGESAGREGAPTTAWVIAALVIVSAVLLLVLRSSRRPSIEKP